jgi:hypothetical protein
MGYMSPAWVDDRDSQAIRSLIVSSARCWQKARHSGVPTQPCLYSTLNPCGCCLLTPVFDGLMRSYEAYLDRPLRTGEGAMLSADEERLIDLLTTFSSKEAASQLDDIMACAVRSSRIMVAMIVL